VNGDNPVVRLRAEGLKPRAKAGPKMPRISTRGFVVAGWLMGTPRGGNRR
jgi:hypothetical protein